MPTGLRRFSPAELLLTPSAAWEALRFFFPGDVVGIFPEDLTLDDRLFAQALLVAALDETRSLGAVPAPEETPLVAAGWVRLRPVVAQLVACGRAEWNSVPVPEGAEPVRIVEPARASVSIRYRAGWIAHVRGGPLL